MKLSKLTIALLVVLAVVCLATSVNAFSNNDLKDYVTGDQNIKGVTYKLDGGHRDAAINRLNSHPVSDEQAASIKADIEAAKAGLAKAIEAEGVKGVTELSASAKAAAFSKIQAAAATAGVTVVADKDGNITAKDAKTGEVITQIASKDVKNVFKPVVFGSIPGAAGTVGGAAPAGNGSSTVNGFAKTGSNVPVYAVVSLIALVAVSAYFVKKVNA